MDIQAIKLDVMQKIMGVNQSSVLEKINEILNKEMIVGYTVSGEPLDIEAYKKDVDEARKEVRLGKVISQEELEKKSKNW